MNFKDDVQYRKRIIPRNVAIKVIHSKIGYDWIKVLTFGVLQGIKKLSNLT